MLAKAETSSGGLCKLPGSHQAQLSSSYFCVAIEALASSFLRESRKGDKNPLDGLWGDKGREIRVIPCSMVNLKCF